MKGLFFPDTNHNESKSIKAFCEALPKLQEAGTSVVFLEFLYENIVGDDERMKEHFIYCSAGRVGMAQDYIGIVHLARKLGLEVYGLARPEYYRLSRTMPGKSLVFRGMGPFDGIASMVIRKYATNKPFVVFLGSGHWPVLTHFIPELTAPWLIEEKLMPLDTVARSVEYMPEMMGLADEYSNGAYSIMMRTLATEHSKVIDGLLREREHTDSIDVTVMRFQDKVGIPPNALQLNYMIAKSAEIPPKMAVLRLNIKPTK